MFCEKCGTKLPENTKFCHKCGAPVGQGADRPSGVIIQNPAVQQKRYGLSIASMVCGILALLLFCVTCLSFILAVLGILFGIIALATGSDGKAMAIIGIVTSVMGPILAVSIGAMIGESIANSIF